jgi:DNA-binding beta-propeller fold protein YncE
LDSAYDTTLSIWGFDVSSASFVDSFSVTAQESQPSGLAFNANGTKMFVVGFNGDDVNEYTLSTAFDVSTASFVDSFSISSEATSPLGLAFNTDGTKMFVVDSAGDDVNEYVLSTGFDVSTAAYSQNFSVSAQETTPRDVAFSADGTKMFIVGSDSDAVNEYTLSTGFDVSTASFVDSFSVAGQETLPSGIAFNPNGTKMFVVGMSGDDVNEYTLSTGFDVSTATFVDSFSVSSQDTEPRGIQFNSDGSKMFIVGYTNDSVYQYSMPTSLTLGTGSFASADVGKTIEANSGAFVLTATDGSYVETTAPTSYDQVASGDWSMYGVVYNAADGDLELSGYLAGQFDISNASYVQSISAVGFTSGVAFNTDGTKMFVTGATNDAVYEYVLSTSYDLSTASLSQSFSVAAQETDIRGVTFNTDGTKMFIVGSNGDDVNEYTLSTGFNVGTASYSTSFSVSSQETDPAGIAFNTDGTKMFIVGFTGDDVNEYTLSTGFSIATASYSQNFSVAAQDTIPTGITFNNDGTKMYIVGYSGDDVNEYILATAFDVSTASYLQSFSVASQETQPRGIAFNSDGSKMFIAGSQNDKVYEYSISTTAYIPTGYQPVHTTVNRLYLLDRHQLNDG